MADYTVVCADLDRDRDEIVALWARNLAAHSLSSHAKKYTWYYQENPYGPGRCWLLVARPGGRIVGTAGLGLRRIQLGEATVVAGLASDFAVDKEYRFLLPALKLQKAVQAAVGEDLALTYCLPNSASIAILRQLGYQTPWSLKRYVKVLHVERYLQSLPVFPKRGGHSLAAAIDLFLLAVSRETWRRTRGCVLEELRAFDERFDDLWQRTAGAVPMTGVRKPEFLRWRYSACPVQRYITLGLLGLGGDRLLGYVVCCMGPKDQVQVVDLWADHAANVADDLLSGLISWARSRDAVSVACDFFGARPLEQGLRRFGFRPRPSLATLSVFPRPGGPCAGATRWIQDWYFLPGDEDYN
jgi:hypothetical protein